MNNDSASRFIAPQNQGQSENKQTAYFQSLINDMEIQNKRYAELASRLECVLQKLANEPSGQKEPGVPNPQTGPTGYINTLMNNIERFSYINNKAEDSVSKLEKLF